MPNRDWILKNPEKYLIWKNKLSESRRNYIKKNLHFQDGSRNPMYGKPSWNRGLTKETDSRVLKYSLTRIIKIRNGKIVPYFKSKKHTLEHRKKVSLSKIGNKNPMKRKDVRMKVSKSLRNKWKVDKEFIHRMLTSFKNLKMNNFEKEFQVFIETSELPFVYVGDGKFWVGPTSSGIRRNPDFRHIYKKKVILLSGEHWHSKKIENQIRDYKTLGYEVLNIWWKIWLKNTENCIEKTIQFSN